MLETETPKAEADLLKNLETDLALSHRDITIIAS